MIALVGESISRMPGPPFGPSLRMTMTSPFPTLPSRIACKPASSPSKTRALPVKLQAFLAGDFRDRAVGREVAVKDDEVAVLFDRVRERPNDVLSCGIRLHLSRFPPSFAGDGQAVAVQQARVEQHLHQRPDAADRDQFGHRVVAARLSGRRARARALPMRVKSSSVSFTRAACAIASRCSTALVEPPSAMTTVIAFSKASAS